MLRTSLNRIHGLLFPWAYHEGFNDGLVLGFFDEDIVADAVGVQDFQMVVVAYELWTVAREAI